MKLIREESIINFNVWGGAIDTCKHLTNKDFEVIEAHLEDVYPEGMEETQLNDILWFEDDMIANLLGYSDFEELREAREG